VSETLLHRGAAVWVNLDPTRGREQAGTRPAVVIASDGYLASVRDLVIVIPVTTRDRRWPHHVRLGGEHLALERASFAMTEQPRTIARTRITGGAGAVGPDAMAEIDQWLRDFTDL
jgi:mRNA interferase MazF